MTGIKHTNKLLVRLYTHTHSPDTDYTSHDTVDMDDTDAAAALVASGLPLFDVSEARNRAVVTCAHATLTTGGVSPDTNDRSAAASERLTTADVQEVKKKKAARRRWPTR